ncbi:hypothetical protein FRC08_001720 [Ceratobasidium sp. 394]|nr:hypothetical protein FRC08_001720 [Ceratobasidium sp. 394]
MGAIQVNRQHYDDPAFLHKHGWAMEQREMFYTTWKWTSTFSNGMFVDWSSVSLVSQQKYVQEDWDMISAELTHYESLGEELWYPLIEAAITAVTRLLSSSPATQGISDQIPTVVTSRQPAMDTTPSSQSILTHLGVTKMQPEPVTGVHLQCPPSPDDIMSWTHEPELKSQHSLSDPITTAWSSAQHPYEPTSSILHSPEAPQTQSVLVPGTPSNEGSSPVLVANKLDEIRFSSSSQFPSQIQATPVHTNLAPSHSPTEVAVTYSSQAPFPMDTGCERLESANPDDSDDPENAGKATKHHPLHSKLHKNSSFPSHASTQAHTQQLEAANLDFVMDTGYLHISITDPNDSDDPDNQPVAHVGRHGELPRFGTEDVSAPATPQVSGHKCAATKTSPESHLRKKTTTARLG